MYTRTLSILFIALLVLSSACSNSVSGEDEHAEPEGFRLKVNGNTLVQQLPDASLTGSIELVSGEETSLITVWFIDHDGDEFQPDVEEGHSLGYEFSVANIVEFEQHTEDGDWSFHLHGEAVGTTTLSVILLHNGHSDFETVAIPVTVTASN